MYAGSRRIPHTHILLLFAYCDDVLDRFFDRFFDKFFNALEQKREKEVMKSLRILGKKWKYSTRSF